MNLKRIKKNAKKGIGVIPRDNNPANHFLRMVSDPKQYQREESIKRNKKQL